LAKSFAGKVSAFDLMSFAATWNVCPPTLNRAAESGGASAALGGAGGFTIAEVTTTSASKVTELGLVSPSLQGAVYELRMFHDVAKIQELTGITNMNS
jgi:hypothetical protein